MLVAQLRQSARHLICICQMLPSVCTAHQFRCVLSIICQIIPQAAGGQADQLDSHVTAWQHYVM